MASIEKVMHLIMLIVKVFFRITKQNLKHNQHKNFA